MGSDVSRPAAVTDEMVSAYLEANDAYWAKTDAMWRTGTAREATRVSLEAALATRTPEPQAEHHLSNAEQGALRRALMRSAKFVDDDRAHALPPLPEAALRTVENEGGESVYPPYYTADQMLKYARETVDLLVGKRSK